VARRALIRGGVAATVSFALAVGLSPLTTGTAFGEPVAGEVVVPATPSQVPKTALLSAGPSGFLRFENDRGYLWTSYTGADTVVDASGTDPFGTPDLGAGSDVVARYDDASRTVTLRDMSTGESRTVTLPAGHRYWNTLGSTVVTIAGSLGTDAALHLLDLQDDGSVTDRAVEGLPAVIDDMYEVNAALGDAHGQVVQYRTGTTSHVGWLDADQGRWVTLPYNADLTPGHIAVTPTHLLWWQNGTVSISSRQDLTAAPRTVPLAGDGQLHGMIGDTLIVSRYDSSLGRYDYWLPVWRVEAVALDGSATKTLLARSRGLALPTPDGRLLVAGGPDTDHWGVSLVEAGSGGGVTIREVADAYPQQAVHQVSQLTLVQGRLNTLERDPAQQRTFLYTRETGVSGSLTVGARTARGPVPADYDNCWNTECPALHDTGDGRTVVTGLNHGGPTADPQPQLLGPTQSLPGTRIDSSRSYMRTAAVSGRFAALMGPYSSTGHETRVIDLDSGRTVFTTMEHIQAMWGTTLWVADGNDSVVPVDVLTGQRGTPVWFERGCLLEDLQAVGRWLLYTCVGSAEGQGVFDTVKGTNLRLVDGPEWGRAGLGDGFVVTEESGQLKVTDVRSGTPVSHTAGEFASWRPWAVDPYTGLIAHAGQDSAIHLVPSGVPVSALSQLDATVATSVDVKGGAARWSPKWWLSKPAASWKLAIRNKATGKTVRTLSGGLARGLVSTAWNGKDDAGRLVPNGAYTWTLTATPADGQGAALTRSGSVSLSGGAAVYRDFVGSDGFGELLTLNGSGVLTYHRGSGTGTFSTKTSGSGWATTVKAVPYGDLNGDRCNDVLVRFSSGALRAYKPGCGKALTPSTPYTTLGTSGWNQYDILTSPGDVTGDGRADLIARQSSTGDLYLYKATSTGKLSARTKIFSRWTGYKKIVGAGDLNGDGRADCHRPLSVIELVRR